MSPDGKTLALANVVAIQQYDVASGKMLGLPMFGSSQHRVRDGL